MSSSPVRLSWPTLGRWILMGSTLLSAPAVAGEDIYKSIDAQGRPVYSDRPLSSNAERVRVETGSRNAAAAQAQAAQEMADLARREEERDRQLAADKAAKQTKAAAEKEQAARCVAARNRYLMFAEGNRLYRRDEAGNRVYYTGAEIDTQRESSKQQMDQLCGQQPQ